MGRHWHGGAHLFTGASQSNRPPALPTYALDIDKELREINELRTRKPSWGSRATVENDSLESCGLCSGSGKIREGKRLCPDCRGVGKIAKKVKGK
jgi:DnaJ-class molecular chaperone